VPRLSYDDEIQRLTEIERITNGKSSYYDMDEAFCARMHAAITAGLESAPTAVVTTPGTKRPKYVSDLNRSEISSILNGRRRISASLARTLGLRRVYVVE
jgi:hypothetical protein